MLNARFLFSNAHFVCLLNARLFLLFERALFIERFFFERAFIFVCSDARLFCLFERAFFLLCLNARLFICLERARFLF